LAGVLFLCWLLTLAGQVEDFFGPQGWFDREAYEKISTLPEGEEPPFPAGWSVLYLCGSNTALLHGVYWGSIAVLVLFTLGLGTRLTSVLTWVIVVSFLGSPAGRYDADYLLAMLAFYLMIGYLLLGQWSRPQTLLGRVLGPRDTFLLGPLPKSTSGTVSQVPSYAANLTMRLLQVHFAIVIVASGLHKLQFGDWWSGSALWYPLHPPFETDPESLLNTPYASAYMFFLSLAQYLMLAWQIGFPFFAWRKRWRVVLLGGTLIGWLGLIFIWRLPVLGPMFFIGSLCYLTTEEWLWVARLLSRAAERVGIRKREAAVRTLEAGGRGKKSEVKSQEPGVRGQPTGIKRIT
jgi:hypothetical protein